MQQLNQSLIGSYYFLFLCLFCFFLWNTILCLLYSCIPFNPRLCVLGIFFNWRTLYWCNEMELSMKQTVYNNNK